MSCIFCEIIARRAPASFVHEDELVVVFMTLRPTAPGECLVIPRTHVDHFTDLPDGTARHIMGVAQRSGRRVREVFCPERVGVGEWWTALARGASRLKPRSGSGGRSASSVA